MNIITTTLNPAFDLHYDMKEFKLYKENYVDSILIAAGGKGINISRVLSNNDIKNTAYVILGKENASSFVSELKAGSIDFKGIYCEGRIRENITIHTPGMPETRISLDSFCVTDDILSKLFEDLMQVADEDTILTFSGRIPKGLSMDYVIDFLSKMRSQHCLIAVDCNSFSMDELVRIRPWLIKPNEQEIKALAGEQVDTVEKAMRAAVSIKRMGVENVIISMGKQGAVAVLADFKYIVEVPDVTPISTIGAGDSMIAGFIGAYSKGMSMDECLKNAAAYGTAACLTQGTNPPKPDEIKKLIDKIKIIQVH